MQSIRLIDFCEEDEKTYYIDRRNIIKLIATELAAQLAVVATKCLYDYYFFKQFWKMLQNLLNR